MYQPLLCSDGAPNQGALKYLKRDMPRTLALSSSASRKQIISAVCADSDRATGPQIDSAVKYIFAWKEFKTASLTYDSIMDRFYYGDWDGFCGTKPVSSFAQKLQSASGTSWVEDRTYNRNQFQLVFLTGKFEAYEDSTGRCFAFRFENAFDADQVATTYGMYYRGQGTWKTLLLKNLNTVIFDGTFGDACSKAIKASIGGVYR